MFGWIRGWVQRHFVAALWGSVAGLAALLWAIAAFVAPWAAAVVAALAIGVLLHMLDDAWR